MKKYKNMPLAAAVAVCVISVLVMIIVLTAGRQKFEPPAFDENAAAGIPDVPEDLGWSELDAKAFKVCICGAVKADGDKIDVWLTNPDSNTVWLKLRVMDEDGNILGETGIIKPGEYVQSVVLEEVPDSGSQIVLKLMAYEPETYYSAGAVTLNTTIR